MGPTICSEFVPVGAAKCPWYEFSLGGLSGEASYEVCEQGERISMGASISMVSLKRNDFAERKAKV